MRAAAPRSHEQTLLRIGAASAVLGTLLQVAAGTGFGRRPHDGGAEAMLRWLADRPDWYWPAVYLGFMLGALLWVGAFVSLAGTLAGGTSRALGRLGLAAITVGVAIHIVDASVSGGGLRIVADHWADASGPDQAALLRDGETLLAVLEGTWASVITFFHGLPFILMGLAVARSRDYPAWLGWIGVVGGAESFLVGMAMFASEDAAPDAFFIAGALVISLFMLLLGALLYAHADDVDRAGEQAGASADEPAR